jgi:hypothetical protein
VASPFDLTDLLTVKSQLVPALTETSSDAQLSALITGVSNWIHKYCSRVFVAQSYVETRNGNERDSMRTKNWPIIAGSQLSINGQIVTEASGPIAAGWVNDDKFLYLRSSHIRGGGGGLFAPHRFPKGIKNVTFSYTAGFVTPGQVAISELPAWAANIAVTIGTQILQESGFYYTAQTTGVAGAESPTFPTRVGATVTDGTNLPVVWICNGLFTAPPDDAEYLPESIRMACNYQVSYLFGRVPNIGNSSTGEGPQRTTYVVKDAEPYVKDQLNPFRSVVPIGDF